LRERTGANVRSEPYNRTRDMALRHVARSDGAISRHVWLFSSLSWCFPALCTTPWQRYAPPGRSLTAFTLQRRLLRSLFLARRGHPGETRRYE
jgi:hypothetical protein